MIGELAKELGFKQVSLSSDLIPMVRIVPRGHTAAVDAYLTPNIQEYLKGFLSGQLHILSKLGIRLLTFWRVLSSDRACLVGQQHTFHT